MKRVGTEILLHDENRPTGRRQSAEPVPEHFVQCGLADLDGRIAPDEIEAKFGIHLLGVDHVEIRHSEPSRVAFGEVASSLVHVDGDDAGSRSPSGERQCDRTCSTAQIEEHAIVGRRGRIGEQVLGAGVEPTVGEDSVIGLEIEGVVGQDDGHGARL